MSNIPSTIAVADKQVKRVLDAIIENINRGGDTPLPNADAIKDYQIKYVIKGIYEKLKSGSTTIPAPNAVSNLEIRRILQYTIDNIS